MAWLTARFETMKRSNIQVATMKRAVRAMAEIQLTQLCLLISTPLKYASSEGAITKREDTLSKIRQELVLIVLRTST